ncbi:MAG: alpha/beta hydrolase [Proteobacteria bacterium]|nr:alpha/beta hydrolase [Pseudomonadota bacterium]
MMGISMTQDTASPQLQLHQYLTSKESIHIRYGVFGHKQPSQHILLFILGRGEWIEKYISVYEEFYKKLQSTIIIVDHVGQGASGGIPGHINSYDDYISHLSQLIAANYKKHTYSIVAHSMGGLIALYGTLKQQFCPQKMILSAPLIGLPQKPVPRLLARPTSHFLSQLGMERLPTMVKSEIRYSFVKNRLTSDKEKYRFIQATPYPISSPTFGWVQATFQACEFIHYDTNISHLCAPILIFYGGREKVVSPSSIQRWVKTARKLSSSTIELVHFRDARHEVFMESEDILKKALKRSVEFLSVPS